MIIVWLQEETAQIVVRTEAKVITMRERLARVMLASTIGRSASRMFTVWRNSVLRRRTVRAALGRFDKRSYRRWIELAFRRIQVCFGPRTRLRGQSNSRTLTPPGPAAAGPDALLDGQGAAVGVRPLGARAALSDGFDRAAGAPPMRLLFLKTHTHTHTAF